MATFIVVVAARLSGGRHREFRTLAGGALDASIFPPAFVNSTLADVNTTMLFFVDTPNDAICHVGAVHGALQQQALFLRTPSWAVVPRRRRRPRSIRCAQHCLHCLVRVLCRCVPPPLPLAPRGGAPMRPNIACPRPPCVCELQLIVCEWEVMR